MSQLPAYEAAYAVARESVRKELNLSEVEAHNYGKRIADKVIEAYVSEMVRQQGYVVPRQRDTEGTTGIFTGSYSRP